MLILSHNLKSITLPIILSSLRDSSCCCPFCSVFEHCLLYCCPFRTLCCSFATFRCPIVNCIKSQRDENTIGRVQRPCYENHTKAKPRRGDHIHISYIIYHIILMLILSHNLKSITLPIILLSLQDYVLFLRDFPLSHCELY